jgi:hypothetical protein
MSSTFAPYYDIILDEKSKSNLCDIKMSEQVSNMVKSEGLKKLFSRTNKSAQSSATEDAVLIKFKPNKSAPSDLLTDV